MLQKKYEHGFSTEVESERLPKGLCEERIREISALRDEPKFMLDWRLAAYRFWKTCKEPRWINAQVSPIDYDALCYFSAPKEGQDVLSTFEKLGLPTGRQTSDVAVDLVFDSKSIGITSHDELKELGVILCPISESIVRFPDLVRKYLGSVVPVQDNFFSALNSAVFSDGSFVYVPKGVHCPIDLSTYFRMNDREAGQFERTLIIADKGSKVSYLEGCTAPAYLENLLHAAVVELVAEEGAEITYSTVQNWYPGDQKTGRGGVYNFVTKRGLCQGNFSKISWNQIEVGSAVTWKYPSCILKGDHSSGQFYSVAVTNGSMQADTGTKMIHLGKNTKSTIVSKGICADRSSNTYRGKVHIDAKAVKSRNYSCCDTLLLGEAASSATFPTVDVSGSSSVLEHEATTSKLNEEKLFYLRARGLSEEEAMHLIVNGFCKEVVSKLPLEFAAEVKHLLTLKLENSIG